MWVGLQVSSQRAFDGDDRRRFYILNWICGEWMKFTMTVWAVYYDAFLSYDEANGYPVVQQKVLGLGYYWLIDGNIEFASIAEELTLTIKQR